MTEPRQDTVENVAEAIAAEIDAIDAELENVSALAVPYRDEFRREASQRIARAAINAMSDVREALERIEQNWGHCSNCGTPCEGFTDGCCDSPSWAPDDPQEVARAALESLSGGGK